MIDIETIGTGGGSIAWITREGHLKVGPRSAGAEPGPMCYPNGGDEPTITDANLVPRPHSAGADRRRHRARRRRAPAPGIAALAARLPGSMSAEQLAHGIIEIANWNQANAIRQMTIQRGIDPRDFALLSFGGAGPAQSPAVMELIGMKACIVPPNPGNLSAFGLLAVDWRTDHIVTKVMHEDAVDLAAVAAIYAGLEQEAVATLRARRHRTLAHPARARGRRALRRPVDGGARGGARRRGRCHVPRRPDRGLPRRASAHLRLQLRRPAEGRAGQFLRVRLRPDRAAEHAEARQRAPARRRSASSRPVYFDGAFRDTPVYDRATLPPGCPARRAGRGRGVRLHHRRVSRPVRWRSIRTAF